MKDRCGHINENLSMCQRKGGYKYTNRCKNHINDIDCESKKSKIQTKRLDRLRDTIEQIKNEVGYKLEK